MLGSLYHFIFHPSLYPTISRCTLALLSCALALSVSTISRWLSSPFLLAGSLLFYLPARWLFFPAPPSASLFLLRVAWASLLRAHGGFSFVATVFTLPAPGSSFPFVEKLFHSSWPGFSRVATVFLSSCAWPGFSRVATVSPSLRLAFLFFPFVAKVFPRCACLFFCCKRVQAYSSSSARVCLPQPNRALNFSLYFV